jgi:hypothetical protein
MYRILILYFWLYNSKNKGRSRICIYFSHLQEREPHECYVAPQNAPKALIKGCYTFFAAAPALDSIYRQSITVWDWSSWSFVSIVTLMVWTIKIEAGPTPSYGLCMVHVHACNRKVALLIGWYALSKNRIIQIKHLFRAIFPLYKMKKFIMWDECFSTFRDVWASV